MTVPEENRPRTEAAGELLDQHEQNAPRAPGATGRTLREALEEAEVRPDDFKDATTSRRTE
jgi:hypothetical protein